MDLRDEGRAREQASRRVRAPAGHHGCADRSEDRQARVDGASGRYRRDLPPRNGADGSSRDDRRRLGRAGRGVSVRRALLFLLLFSSTAWAQQKPPPAPPPAPAPPKTSALVRVSSDVAQALKDVPAGALVVASPVASDVQ